MPDTLNQGSSGAEVEQLQQLLHDHGYYGGAIDGDFGWRTHVAVTKYQEAAGLRVDGSVGPDTWHSLESASGPQTGLRDDEHTQDYVDSAYGTMNSSMAPHDRLDQLMSAALQELGELGVPLPTYDFDHDLSGKSTNAEFRSYDQWFVAVNPDRFDPQVAEQLDEQALGAVATTLYHETRHAEVTFREARAQAGLGHDAAGLVATMHLPQWVADLAVADPILESTADGGTDEALRGYDSFYGSGHDATQAVYDHGTYEEYRRLPEEDDAKEAGHNVNDAWRAHAGIRGTVEEGDHGEDVAYLQRALIQLTFLQGAADGDFGPATRDAVIAFQQYYSLTPDGVCGEHSWAMLGSVYAE